MKQNPNYTLLEIANIPYLLPVGQMIADHRRSVKINETGVFIWNLLDEECSLEEILDSCIQHYEPSPEEIPLLTEDIHNFISSLENLSIILSDKYLENRKPAFYKSMEIAGLKINLYGKPEVFSPSFDAFSCDYTEEPDQIIEFFQGYPVVHENGKLLLRNHELSIMECKDKYICLFPSSTSIQEVHLTKDGSLARFYYLNISPETLQEELFHAIRLVFLYLAQAKNMVILHSASILYQGRAWLFSASSGTGKSTHTNLWQDLFQTPVINGDLNLITIKNGQAVVHGIPWCGTSGICDTKTYPLGGVILLKRGPKDKVENLSEDEKRLLVVKRLISPAWTSDLLSCNLQLMDQLAKQIFIGTLYCTPTASAVETIKASIDAYLNL